jgi:hypothetical protein
MLCESCGRPSSTQSATLYQNIGMIAVFRYRTLKGTYCKLCITHYFWEYTLVTLALGWWGVISFILTPLVLVNNLYYFLRAQLGQQQPHLGAPQRLGTTPEACPRCHSFQTRTVGLSRSVWASILISLLLLMWAGYLSLQMIQHRTPSPNWVVVGFFVGINLLVALCLVMVLRHPLGRCMQCHWTWPTHNNVT